MPKHLPGILLFLVILLFEMLMACGRAQENHPVSQASEDQPSGRSSQASQKIGQYEQFIDLAGELGGSSLLNDDERIDLQCLRQSYPAIKGLVRSNDACLYLVIADGQRLLYKRPDGCNVQVLEADIATSMAQPYPLEPSRPETPTGMAPGRQRSRELLTLIYGQPEKIGKNLRTVSLQGRGISLAAPAATAFSTVIPKLHSLAHARPELARWLKSDGGYFYRKIAGENRLSPHSYGIALDLSAHFAAYWRWSRQRPHPLQKSYPGEIVSAFEDAGFIWGGKWHEYDIMHFEYRPEIICKARILANRRGIQEDGGHTGPDGSAK